MADKTLKVTLTLRTAIAERLRAMCHARGETASQLIDRWIFAHDENGNPRVSEEKPTVLPRDPMAGFMDEIFGRKRQ